MAGAKPGVHIVQLKRVVVPKFMTDGEKFVKWDEDSGQGNQVTLKVDPNGFFVYWTNGNKDVDLLDISTIRDTRTGKGAKIPKDPRLRQIVSMGSQDTLEEKTVTIVSGPDFVNLTFFNFCCTKKETAKMWADELLSIAYNLLQLNSPIMSFLMKIHCKLSIMTDKQGKIPVKNIIKTFAQNKEDRKKVEKALDASGLPSGKSPLAALPKPVEKLAKTPLLMNDTISPSKFGFEEFFTFYKNLTVRSEVERVFDEISQYNKKKLMSAEQFMEFINKEQRDPRLNEILYPYTTPEKAKELIDAYEPNPFNASRGMLSLEGFLRYILSEDNAIVSMEKFDLSDDMDQPLNHYFINSSHNTYLTGHQLTGKSSAEMYRQCLLAGCRCVELDFWNGRTEEPIIVHGYTLVEDISAKDVIEAIAESAFKTSDYPVVLSFENHCNPKQQAKIAQYCREFFGPLLLDVPLDAYPLEPGSMLPPPSSLKRRIIIKNKKKHHHHKPKPQKKMSKTILPENGESPPLLSKDDSKDSADNEDANNVTPVLHNIPDEDVSTSSDDEDDSAEPDSADRQIDLDKSQSDKGTAGRETEAGAEISALVNYVQPVHFTSFDYALHRNKCYEMSSFDEKQAMTCLKEKPVEFVNYNKFQLSRIYPKGTRVDSANFMPQIFWNAGCQLVALNYQTLDLAMQLNLGIFELNNQCGYLLKPEFMRRKDRRFDPFAESTVDGIIAGTVSIQVISGQFMSDKRVGTYVEVEMYGLPTDTIRKKFKTKMIAANGINPVYDEEPFVFKKVVLPDLACIRIAAYEDSGRLIGHRVLPVVGLRPGYRHVVLRNESGQPLNLPTIFLNIRVKDYVPDGLSDFAEALANPIKYQSELEKRSKQLSVLQDDTTQDDSSTNEDSESTVPSVPRIPKVQMSIRKPKSIENTCSEVSASPPSGISLPMPIQTKTESIEEGKKCLGPMPPPPPNLAAFAMTGGSDVTHIAGSSSNDVAAPFIFAPELLDKYWENKTYREKKAQLEKKVEEMRKKHEKDRKDRKPPKKSHRKLVTRLSSKNLEDTINKKESFPASQSFILEQLMLEKDALEKGHEELFKVVEKTIRDSQGKQLKMLSSRELKDGEGVMKWIDNWRKDEFKRLAKQTKDKNELDRYKREVTRTLVEKGVVERERKAKLYHEIKTQLELAHKDVLRQFEDCKLKKIQEIEADYKERFNKLSALAEETSGGVGVVAETFPETPFHVEELRPAKQ